jgi:hypothetical protein
LGFNAAWGYYELCWLFLLSLASIGSKLFCALV